MPPINEKRARLVELLQCVSLGSEPAFAEMYEMTHAYLYNVAFQVLRSAHHAEEVLQEAYLLIWQYSHRYQPHLGTAMTWLITVVRNQSVSLLRRQGMECRSFSLEQHVGEFDELVAEAWEESDAIEQVFYESMRSRLPAAMARLEPAQRQVIALTFGQGMAHAELSAHLCAPLGTVKSWIRRGLMHLSRYLAEQETNALQNAVHSLTS